MTSLFPFADPLRRLENALRHCAADATAGRRSFLSSIEHLWALWQLYPDYHTRVVLRSEFRCHCRAIMRGLTRAMRRCGVYQLHPIYVCTLVLTTWLTQSSDFRRYADYLPLRDAIARVKGLFGDYTSGSKLCNRIAQCLNLSIGYNHEGLEHKWFNIVHFFQHHEIQRHHMTSYVEMIQQTQDDIVATLGTFFPDSLIFYRVLVPNPETDPREPTKVDKEVSGGGWN
ncbi:hypothetical protein Poli38472_005247 [Pythium oligandrum]|uniref:Uncharacterized protein n=1 Tax=Pythium oligandrum TaxID=41045 RepID=A0A8K1CGJ1_PYTOL|nr:hypothetical protein Poli38472_005247 [Pythium oligandrum]|eukprot:TMW62629.1 hypothetical protein Poli38472_005247 [Pythium oligandrum]